jgi:Mg-chelatase subunit ChlD
MSKQNVVVGAAGSDINQSLHELDGVIKSHPGSTTPLIAALNSVIADITRLTPELRAAGRSVSVIIASDGQASDGDMNTVKATLAPLANLPCDVVIRLCTDEVHVVNYWNDIDNDLEVKC